MYPARQLVRPGLTGWAQVRQRQATIPDAEVAEFEYDLYYVRHASLLADLVILVRALAAPLGRRRGA